MSVVDQIKAVTVKAIKELYAVELTENNILVNATKPEFEGDYTVVLFAFVKQLKKSPDALGNELGNYLIKNNSELFTSFNIIKGFLNLVVTDNYWIQFLQHQHNNISYGVKEKNGERVMVEYSSPNTNKPLHLGHLRNNFLGWSIAEILNANGYDVVKTCIVNDRGIHICKSMIAWQLFANGATPQSTNTKGDHFVGDYYVKFNDEYKKQVEELIATGINKEDAEKQAPIMKATQQMLLDWEAGKPDVMELWKNMNSWVYDGFDTTYKTIGSDFDKIYYESNTYLLGKSIVEKGLEKKVFFKKEDGSVWIDLTADGLDEKVVMRKDGTSVYITQDIGLAEQKQNEFNAGQSIYVVGDEQNYHFKVLKLICEKLGLASADQIYHLSYGMVELPTGKMKSREGTVVDADDLVEEMISISQQKTEELGKVKDFTADELKELYNTIGLGALKFFLLRVDPKKKMVFNPEESIDFHGFTGPFVQYTHARIKSILRKMEEVGSRESGAVSLLPLEKELIIQLEIFPSIIQEAAAEHDPSKLAIYIFNLAKVFNSFYSEHSIANAESEDKKQLRLRSAQLTANVIKKGMSLLGIKVPERM
ncbi:arginine--tRNA ligase [mine drainage metagenome]|uniref:arginine--tRNA ligase n=1 Tax=mine drainage metagenome TaxID=410659 RepID=A0A1J5T0B3_9ZZZZ